MPTATETRLTLTASELDRRAGGGQRVRLLWVPDANEALVEQLELKTEQVTLRRVPQGEALNVFVHPEQYPIAALNYDYRVDRGEIEIPLV